MPDCVKEPAQAALQFPSEESFEAAVHVLFPSVPCMEAGGTDVLLIPEEHLAAAKQLLGKKGIKFRHVPIVCSADISDAEWEKAQEKLPSFSELMQREVKEEGSNK